MRTQKRIIGWTRGGEYRCKCGTIFGKNLLNESPWLLVGEHRKICGIHKGDNEVARFVKQLRSKRVPMQPRDIKNADVDFYGRFDPMLTVLKLVNIYGNVDEARAQFTRQWEVTIPHPEFWPDKNWSSRADRVLCLFAQIFNPEYRWTGESKRYHKLQVNYGTGIEGFHKLVESEYSHAR